MNRRDSIIYASALAALAAELVAVIIAILAQPLSDTALRIFGIIILITAIPAAYGFVRKLMERRR